MKRWIEVSFQKEGIHAYPTALTDPNLITVRFLGHPHRHMFYFYVRIEVFHNDRDIEFIMFKRWLVSLFDEQLTSDFKSCEMFAESLINIITVKYPYRDITVKVFEDDENGAILEWKVG